MAEHSLGPADAPVTLTQYGDYECIHCRRAHHVLAVVLPELGDKVRLVFRNFPIIASHPDALPAAEAAESVAAHGGEDAFWAMHSILFENQDALGIDDLLGYAEAAGVEPARVAEDLSAGTMRARVRADMNQGLGCGVSGTPAFFVNGRRFHGDWSDPDALTAALQEAARVKAYH